MKLYITAMALMLAGCATNDKVAVNGNLAEADPAPKIEKNGLAKRLLISLRLSFIRL
ncbi:hypothetical protein ACVFI8_01265 [Agarivorans sp. MS3-6]